MRPWLRDSASALWARTGCAGRHRRAYIRTHSVVVLAVWSLRILRPWGGWAVPGERHTLRRETCRSTTTADSSRELPWGWSHAWRRSADARSSGAKASGRPRDGMTAPRSRREAAAVGVVDNQSGRASDRTFAHR